MNLSKIMALGALIIPAACTPAPHQLEMAQERHACAELGIDPDTRDFSNCVDGLDASLFRTENAAAR
jgi:hypothetical protein